MFEINLLLRFLGIVLLVALYTEAIMTPEDRQDQLPQFPFRAFIQATYTPKDATEPVTIYGVGSLVRPSLVITSAYFLNGIKDATDVSITVSVGLTDPAEIDANPNTFKDLNGTAVIFDPLFDPDTSSYNNNAALIRLPRDVTDVPVATIVEEGMTVARNECYVLGFGAYSPGGTYPNKEKIAPSPLLCKEGERTKCFERNTALTGQIFTEANFDYCSVSGTVLCAGYFQSPTYIGACSSDVPALDGDVGAPVVCNLAANRGQTQDGVLVGYVLGDSCVNDPKVPLGPPDRVPAIIINVKLEVPFIDENDAVDENDGNDGSDGNELSECDRFFE